MLQKVLKKLKKCGGGVSKQRFRYAFPDIGTERRRRK